MKKIELKRDTVFVIQRQLKGLPPRLVPTTQEIIITATKVVPALEKHVSEYLKLIEQRVKMAKKLKNDKMTQKEFDDESEKLSKEWDTYNDAHADDTVIVKLEDEEFKTLYEQFQREDKELGKNDIWGRSWVATTNDYIKVDAAFKKAEEEEEDSK